MENLFFMPKLFEYVIYLVLCHLKGKIDEVHFCRFLMASRIIENVMSTALAYACGRFIVVICLTQTCPLLKFHLLLFDRSVQSKRILYHGLMVSFDCPPEVVYFSSIIST